MIHLHILGVIPFFCIFIFLFLFLLMAIWIYFCIFWYPIQFFLINILSINIFYIVIFYSYSLSLFYYICSICCWSSSCLWPTLAKLTSGKIISLFFYHRCEWIKSLIPRHFSIAFITTYVIVILTTFWLAIKCLFNRSIIWYLPCKLGAGHE